MDKEKMEQLLQKAMKDLCTLADSLQAVCDAITGSLPEEKEPPAIPLEKVRGILADKSRNGKTAEVRALILKYGADRLSGIDPKNYAALLREAEVL